MIFLIANCAAQEIRRPTTDADMFGICGGAHIASGVGNVMAKSYDAAGQSTFAAIGSTAQISCSQYSCTGQSTYQARLFSGWQLPQTTYSTLTLNINSKSGGYLVTGNGTSGNACLFYRTTTTGAWTLIRCDNGGHGWLQLTDSITLSATQDLSQLQVAACGEGDTNDGTQALPPPQAGSDGVQIFDIWTVAGTTPQSPGTGSSAGARHNSVFVN